jgi:hypothetical protein
MAARYKPDLVNEGRFIVRRPDRSSQSEASNCDRLGWIIEKVKRVGKDLASQPGRHPNELQQTDHTSPYRAMRIFTWKILDKFLQIGLDKFRMFLSDHTYRPGGALLLTKLAAIEHTEKFGESPGVIAYISDDRLGGPA